MKHSENWIELAIFPYHVAFTTSEKTFKYFMRWMNVQNAPQFIPRADACTHHFENDGRRTSIICMRPKRKDMKWEVYTGLIVHECTHVLQNLQEHIGMRSDSETEAYLMQRLFMDCLSIYEMENRRLAR